MNELTERKTINLINKWDDAKKSLDKFKKLEMKLRLEVVQELAETESAGVYSFEYPSFEFKVAKNNTTSLDVDALSEILSQLSDEERECIVYSPRLSLSLYNKLEDSEVIDECIIVKPACPTVSIKRYEF